MEVRFHDYLLLPCIYFRDLFAVCFACLLVCLPFCYFSVFYYNYFLGMLFVCSCYFSAFFYFFLFFTFVVCFPVSFFCSLPLPILYFSPLIVYSCFDYFPPFLLVFLVSLFTFSSRWCLRCRKVLEGA